MFRKIDWNSKISTPMNANFLWSIEYSYIMTARNHEQNHKRENFFIDITSFPILEDFLGNLERNNGEFASIECGTN